MFNSFCYCLAGCVSIVFEDSLGGCSRMMIVVPMVFLVSWICSWPFLPFVNLRLTLMKTVAKFRRRRLRLGRIPSGLLATSPEFGVDVSLSSRDVVRAFGDTLPAIGVLVLCKR